MRCEEVRALWADHLAGTLDGSVRSGMRDHVASCAVCQAEFGGEELLWRALGDEPLPVPAGRMRTRFLAALAEADVASGPDRGAAASGQAHGYRILAWRPRFGGNGPLVRLTAAASLLLVGVLIGRSTVPTASVVPAGSAAPTEIADVRAELREMRQMLALSLLQQQSATERLRGVGASAELEQPGNEVVTALLDTLLHDPNDNVRLAAVDALRRFSTREDVRRGTKRAVTETASPLLQIAVIDFMVETRDPEAAPLLRQLSQDRAVDELVRGRAVLGLERLSS